MMDRRHAAKVIPLPPSATQEAHALTPTCSVAPDAHWTAHTLACKANRDLVIVQRRAKEVA